MHLTWNLVKSAKEIHLDTQFKKQLKKSVIAAADLNTRVLQSRATSHQIFVRIEEHVFNFNKLNDLTFQPKNRSGKKTAEQFKISDRLVRDCY